MPLFKYSAKDKEGQTRSGTVEALGKEKAAKALEEHQLVPINITAESRFLDFSKISKALGRIKGTELVAFTRQMATMVSSGLPLARALQILEMQTENERMREVIGEARRDVEGGAALSTSFGKHSKVFSKVYTNLIKVGETSGQLDTVLNKLADNVEKQEAFKSKIKGAMIYPAMIFISMVGVFILMMVYVVPQLSEVYKSFDAELPFQTRLIMAMSDLITKRLWLFVAMVVAAIIGYKQFEKTEYGKYFMARFVFKVPVMGKLRKEIEITEFTRTLGLLVSSGVPILQSLQIVSDSMSNLLYRNAVQDAARQVEKGLSLAVPLSTNPYFPPILTQMISVGEETGKLDEVLFRLSSFMEAQTDTTVKNLSTALEPIILVLLGAMVGFLVLSIVMPIYNLTSSF